MSRTEWRHDWVALTLRLFYRVSVLLLNYWGPLLVHNMCLVRPALLYFNSHVLKVFYEQINYTTTTAWWRDWQHDNMTLESYCHVTPVSCGYMCVYIQRCLVPSPDPTPSFPPRPSVETAGSLQACAQRSHVHLCAAEYPFVRSAASYAEMMLCNIGATTVGTGGPTMHWSSQLLGRNFQNARSFTASSHQNAGSDIWVFKKKIPGVILPDLHSGGGDPLPHPTSIPAFRRARGASAPVFGPKAWSLSTSQPALRSSNLRRTFVTSLCGNVHVTTCCMNAVNVDDWPTTKLQWTRKCGNHNALQLEAARRRACFNYDAHTKF